VLRIYFYAAAHKYSVADQVNL